MKKMSQSAFPALVALCLSLFSLPGYTQTSVLAYQGNVMTGTSTVAPPGCCQFGFDKSTLPIIPTVGAFSADVTLSGSLAKGNLAITGWVVDVTLNNGTVVALDDLNGGLDNLAMFTTTTETSVCSTGPIGGGAIGCVDLTTKGSIVTGATFNLDTAKNPKGDVVVLNIGPSGDSFSYTTYAPTNTCVGGYVGDWVSTYVGPAGYVPCTASISSSKPGVWVRTGAPEPPTLALLGLGLVCLGFRRKSEMRHRIAQTERLIATTPWGITMKRILALLVIWPALASAQTYNYQITSGSFIGLTGVLTFAGNGFTGGGFSPGMSTFGPLSLDGWTGSLSWYDADNGDPSTGVWSTIPSITPDPTPPGGLTSSVQSSMGFTVPVSEYNPGTYTEAFTFGANYVVFGLNNQQANYQFDGQGLVTFTVVPYPGDPGVTELQNAVYTFSAPEPATLSLFVMGLAGVGLARRKSDRCAT
jgi:hypothetical protein